MLKPNSMKAIKKWLMGGIQILWGAAILALPFQRFILLMQAGESGRFNPYASVTLQMSEVLVLVAFFLWMVAHLGLYERRLKEKRGKRLLALVIGIVVLLEAPLLWSESLEVGEGAILHAMEAVAALALVRHEALPSKTVAKLFLATVLFQAILGIIQVASGHSVGLSLLGESMVSTQTVGAAKVAIAGQEFLRAYGTFPHPNILAGYLVAGLAMQKRGKIALTLFLAIALLLTGSKAAIGALLITLLIQQKIPLQKKRLIAGIAAILILVTFPLWKNAEFITERWELLKISLAMLVQQPWGVGPHHFTLAMQNFTVLKLQPWQFQPVHNVYLLVANEWGVWTGLLFTLGGLHLLRNHLKKPTLLFILPLLLIGLVDHYLVSLPQGLLLTGIVVGWLTRPKPRPQNHRNP